VRFISHFKSLCHAEAGSFVFEVLLSLSLGLLLLSMVFETIAALTTGAHTLLHQHETAAMWNNANRVLREDVHAAHTMDAKPGGLTIWEANGKVFRYAVNGSSQLVRTQAGGGTAVVAVGVSALDCSAEKRVLTVRLVFQDGFSGTLVVGTLP
jgi:hypothetical protein